MARGSSNNVTAWQLDESVAAAVDGVHVAGVPGIWQPGVPVLPEAFGMGVTEFGELVERLGLPLVKVRVSESKALARFDHPADDLRRFESAPARLGPQQRSAGDGEAIEEAADEAAQTARRAALEGLEERVEAASTPEEEES